MIFGLLDSYGVISARRGADAAPQGTAASHIATSNNENKQLSASKSPEAQKTEHIPTPPVTIAAPLGTTVTPNSKPQHFTRPGSSRNKTLEEKAKATQSYRDSNNLIMGQEKAQSATSNSGGTPANDEIAIDDPNVMRDLGYKYFLGQGVPQDYAKAHQWFDKAALKGDAAAAKGLGLLYYSGKGVAQNYTQALQWFRISAAKGDRAAMGLIGDMYETGIGVTQDHTEARQWYERAGRRP